jgi:hypothetical protein
MISTSGILSTGEKKCRPMKCAGRRLTWARPVMGSVEVLEANTASAPITASASWVHVGLDGAVLEHGLDHQVAALQVFVARGRLDARQQRVALLLRAPPRDTALSSRPCE